MTTGDWQIEVPSRGILFGVGALQIPSAPAPQGFVGSGAVRSNDVPKLYAGTAGVRDTFNARLITFAVRAVALGDAVLVRQLMDRATHAWYPDPLGTDVRLDARFPGAPEKLVSYYGRPRHVIEASEWTYQLGVLVQQFEFAALDPYGYGATRTVTGATTTATLPLIDMGNVGAISRRATITVHGNGGTPVITSTTDSSRHITFAAPLAVDAVIDMHEQTVTIGGVSTPGAIAGTSPWLRLIGGVANSLTIAGCASVDITWRPAYL